MNKKAEPFQSTNITRQNRNNDKLILLIILPVILVLLYFLWLLKADTSAELIGLSYATPVWDLRDYDMENHYVRLWGGVTEFIPGQLLTPEEFSQRTDFITNHPLSIPDMDCYTARYRIIVPDDKIYAISYRSTDYADSIYINGTHMQSVGRPGDRAETAVPQTSMVYFTVRPVNGQIEVLHQISNFVHKEGGNPTALCIGSVESINRHYSRQTLTTAIIMGACLLLFVVHLVLFALIRSYRANLYLALFCLVWTLRLGVDGVRAITLMFPYLPWLAKFRIEYLSIPAAAWLTCFSLDAVFKGLLQKWAKICITAICAVMAIIFLFAPSVLMSQTMQFVYAILLLFAAYILVRFFMKLRKERGVQQIILISGLAVFVYLFIREMLYHNKIFIFPVVPAGMMDFAALVFILFQMVSTFYGTMQEVAAAREAEQRLTAENAALERINRMRAEIMATISHEARTPLAVLASYASLVSLEIRDKIADPQTTADLDKIAYEAKRVANLIEAMKALPIQKERTLNRVCLDVGGLVEQTARLYCHILERKGVEIITDIQEDQPRVFGNPEELTQVVFNLLQNAKNYTEQGSVSISVKKAGGFVTVAVSDTGKGIAAELLPHVFERGARGGGTGGGVGGISGVGDGDGTGDGTSDGTSDGTGDVSCYTSGDGIGLAICKEIIEAHGGTITVESEQNKGTTAAFSLPEYCEAAQ